MTSISDFRAVSHSAASGSVPAVETETTLEQGFVRVHFSPSNELSSLLHIYVSP